MENENKKANEMPKTATTSAAPKKLKELPIKVTATLGTRKNDEKEEVEFLSYVMENPFSNVNLDELRLVFVKPNNTDSRGFSKTDVGGAKNKGLFEHFAIPEIQKDGTLTIDGKVIYHKFKGSEYVQIQIHNTFGVGGDSMRMYIRKPETQAVFDYYAALQLELIPLKA